MALATGTRRVFAVTGPEAVSLFQQNYRTVKALSEQFKVKLHEVGAAVQKLADSHKRMLSEIKHLRKQTVKAHIPVWAEQVKPVGKIPFLFLSLDGYGNDELRNICIELDNQKPGVYFLLSRDTDDPSRVTFVLFASKKITPAIDMKKLSALLKEQCGLRGGGNQTMIQGGGVNVDSASVQKVIVEWVKAQ